MSVRFPYEKVYKGESVLIYGAGEIGQALMWEIRDSEYCTFAGIVDKRFPNDANPPFYSPDRVRSVLFDKVIVASALPDKVKQIVNILKENGIHEEQIVTGDEFKYASVEQYIPQEKLPQRYQYYDELFRICKCSKSMFAGDFVYQSFPELGIAGQRDSKERIKAYDVTTYMHSGDEVLDIGCNCGFLDLQISSIVKHITGVDVDENMIKMGNLTKEYIGIENVDFFVKNLFSCDEIMGRFDVICCFAIHAAVIGDRGVSKERFLEVILQYLNEGGRIFFESHLNRFDECDNLYETLLKDFQKRGFKIIMYKKAYSDSIGNSNRDIVVLQDTRNK